MLTSHLWSLCGAGGGAPARAEASSETAASSRASATSAPGGEEDEGAEEAEEGCEIPPPAPLALRSPAPLDLIAFEAGDEPAAWRE